MNSVPNVLLHNMNFRRQEADPAERKVMRRFLKMVRGEMLDAAQDCRKLLLRDAETFFAAEAARYTEIIEVWSESVAAPVSNHS